MKKFNENILKIEFEARIFVSFSIVLFTGLLTLFVFRDSNSIIVSAGKYFDLSAKSSKTMGFVFLSFLMLTVSLLRMWAGSLLTPKRVMSFKVQTDALTKTGPYRLTRNPIYFADLIAMTGFSFCFPPIGLVIPILFYFHYRRLIKYEEKSLQKYFNESYNKFAEDVPRFFPSWRSIKNFTTSKDHLDINKDGFRYNALYTLFISGFIIASITGNFTFALIIGMPGVIDWGIVHTKIGITKPDKEYKNKKSKPVKSRKKVFSDILYSNCWEDPQIDREAFLIKPDDVVFSITSGGCNVLTFLLDNPKKIIALDLNQYQNILLELKITAFKFLTYPQLLEFLGVRNSIKRIQLFWQIRDSLSQDTKEYWNNNLKKIEKGIINCGRYEKYMRLLRVCLQLLEGNNLINKFFEVENYLQRLILYSKKWNNLRWKIFTKIFLSRRTMSLLFDKAFFKYLDESFSFGNHFSQKTKRAFTELPIKGNYFLSLILLGNYRDAQYLPYYLREENFELIKKNVDKIEIKTGSCEDYFSTIPDSFISKFNFTNIFEWMPEDSFEKLLLETIRVAKDNAIITYRNLLVPREHPKSLDNKVTSIKDLAQTLHKKDLSFIYNNYVVEQIVKEEKSWDMKSARYQTARA